MLLELSQVVPNIPTTNPALGITWPCTHPSQGSLTCLAHVAFPLPWCCSLRFPFKRPVVPSKALDMHQFSQEIPALSQLLHIELQQPFLSSYPPVSKWTAVQMDGWDKVVPKGSAQGHSQMLKKTHNKAQQYHLLFKTRTLGQRRGPQLRPNHKVFMMLMSSLYFITYQEKDVEKDDTLHWAKSLHLVHAPSSFSLKMNQPPNSQLVSSRPLGKVPPASSTSFLLRWGSLTPCTSLLLCSQDLAPWNWVLVPTSQENMLMAKVECADLLRCRQCWGGQGMLANLFPWYTRSFSMAFDKGLDFKICCHTNASVSDFD